MKLILLCLLAQFVSSQINIQISSGDVLALDTLDHNWKPIQSIRTLSKQTYLLTKRKSSAKLFYKKDVYHLQESIEFFINDLLIDSKTELIRELLRLKAKQLFINRFKDSRKVGLNYGSKHTAKENKNNLIERINFIEYAKTLNKDFTAIIACKRIMIDIPSTANEIVLIDNYFKLLKKNDLYSFIRDELKELHERKKTDILIQLKDYTISY